MPSQEESAPPLIRRPPGEDVIFVDFQKAEYSLDFKIRRNFIESATVTTEIWFKALDAGFPAFDFTGPAQTKVNLDGNIDSEFVLSTFPELAEKYSFVPMRLETGTPHTLTCQHDLIRVRGFGLHLKAMGGGVRFRLAMDDTGLGAHFSGNYWPSNFEYDRFPSSIKINIEGTNVEHAILTNGELSTNRPNHFNVEFPDTFTTSSPFLDIVPKNSFEFDERPYTNKNGRPVTIRAYTEVESGRSNETTRLRGFLDKAEDCLGKLEDEIAPYPYSDLLIHARKTGLWGMEYSAATSSSLAALNHELNHLYFARCITPINGNSGWIDEAIAEWAETYYQSRTKPPDYRSNMGGRSKYVRATHVAAYTKGRDLLAFWEHKYADEGGLKSALPEYFEQFKFKSISTEEFHEFLTGRFGESINADFDRYVYGR